MDVIQQATQTIKTPWELIIAILVVFALTIAYLLKNSKEDSKYHRERAEKKDDENREDRKVYLDTINNMNNGMEKKLDKIYEEVKRRN